MRKAAILLAGCLMLTLGCLPFLQNSGTSGGTGRTSERCRFSAEEAAFMDILRADSRQLRASITCHPSIHRVARNKAMDMARRGYYAHTDPDGIGPNYLVQQTGYRLPAHWGTGRDTNYIESINAGRATAREAYNSWINSPGHRRHVLGENDQFAAMTVVAVGHYHDPKSRHKHYWVFLSVPPEP